MTSKLVVQHVCIDIFLPIIIYRYKIIDKNNNIEDFVNIKIGDLVSLK